MSVRGVQSHDLGESTWVDCKRRMIDQMNLYKKKNELTHSTWMVKMEDNSSRTYLAVDRLSSTSSPARVSWSDAGVDQTSGDTLVPNHNQRSCRRRLEEYLGRK